MKRTIELRNLLKCVLMFCFVLFFVFVLDFFRVHRVPLRSWLYRKAETFGYMMIHAYVSLLRSVERSS